MAQHHQRKQVCHTRPAYREGRKEKAVKVYTINDESRYLLVQGVPDLKLTKELLDQCSLYGAIHEYRLLEDFPDKEEFTQVYWIQYQQLQAARIAKRKLDDKPFYGGILHVTYAPEYETVEDTRLKLQDRRKAVAGRIRKLQAQQRDSGAGTAGMVSSSRVSEDSDSSAVQAGFAPDGNKAATSETSQLKQSTEQSRSAVSQSKASGDPSTSTESEFLPQLPLPPQPLPRTQWSIPAQPSSEYPRIPTAHATLPAEFNPYPEGQPAPNTIPQAKLHAKEIGPRLPSGLISNPKTQESTSRDYQTEGAKPKTRISMPMQADQDKKRLSRKRQSSDIYGAVDQQPQHPGSELDLGRPRKQRALDRCSFAGSQQASSSDSGQEVSSGTVRPRGPKSRFLPRQVKAQGQKDLGAERQDTAVTTANVVDPGPNTGNTSLDNTVQDIRNRMRAITETGNRSSQPATRAPSTESQNSEASQAAQRQVERAPLNMDAGQASQRPLRVSRNTRRKI